MHIKNRKIVWYVYYATVVSTCKLRSSKSRIIQLLHKKELNERLIVIGVNCCFYTLTAGIDYMERTFIPAIEQTSD